MTLFSWLFIIAGGSFEIEEGEGADKEYKYENVNEFIYFFFEIFTNSLGDISIVRTQYWTEKDR